jgi:putative membrane protein
MTPSAEDSERIAAAVAAAEQRTSGEIVVVLAAEVSSYREIPVIWAATFALIAPALAVWLGLRPHTLLAGWSAEHAAALEAGVAWAISAYALTQAALFVIVYLIVAWKPIRRALTPAFLRRERTHKAAMAQFMATGLDGAPDRTGVVIFAALDDHVVEIVADEAIHAKVGEGAWAEAVAAMQTALRAGSLAEGIERGVALCGAALARHFPPGEINNNMLPNAPRVI